MKARAIELYNKEIDLWEQSLRVENYNTDRSDIGKKALDDFMHVICGLMKTAFEHGYNGDSEPDYIKKIQNTEAPLMKETAAVLLRSYHDGQEASRQ